MQNPFSPYAFVFNNFTNPHHADFPHGIKKNYISYLKKGKARIVSENETADLNAGELLFIPKGLKYSSHWFSAPELDCDNFSCPSYPESSSVALKPYIIEPTPKMLELIDKISINEAATSYSVGLFYLLLDLVLKTIGTEDKNKHNQLFKEVTDCMITCPDYNISKVAKSCGISEAGLYNLFRQYSETTPAKFKLGVKLDRAVSLLVTTDMPIEEISSTCGFSSSSYFRKLFYKTYNKTPRQMRKDSRI